MARQQFNRAEAIQRLEALTKEYSEARPNNPVGVVKIEGGGYDTAVIASYIGYGLLQKILYVLGRASQEYVIKPMDEKNVAILIRFFN